MENIKCQKCDDKVGVLMGLPVFAHISANDDGTFDVEIDVDLSELSAFLEDDLTCGSEECTGPPLLADTDAALLARILDQVELPSRTVTVKPSEVTG